MRIHDFGLWFREWIGGRGGKWLNTVPLTDEFLIYYDMQRLGYKTRTHNLVITGFYKNIIKLKHQFPIIKDEVGDDCYSIGRPLTLDDFAVVENPDYRGEK